MKRKKRSERREPVPLFIVLLLVLLLGLLVAGMIHANTETLEKKTIKANAFLGENAGFDLNTTALTFGNVVVEVPATRQIRLRNQFSTPITVYINAQGDITPYIFASTSKLTLNPYEERDVSFSVFFPEGTKHREYEGVVEILSKRK